MACVETCESWKQMLKSPVSTLSHNENSIPAGDWEIRWQSWESFYFWRKHEKLKADLHCPYSSGKGQKRLESRAGEGMGNGGTHEIWKNRSVGNELIQWKRGKLNFSVLYLIILYFSVFSRGRAEFLTIRSSPSHPNETFSQLYTGRI